MVNRDFLFLAAFLFEPDQRSFSSLEVILDLQIHDRSNPGKRISQSSKKCFVPMADDVTRIDGSEDLDTLSRGIHDLNTVIVALRS